MLGRGGRADIIGGPGKEGKEGREAVSLESLRPPQSSQNPYLHLTSSSLPVAHPSSLFNGFWSCSNSTYQYPEYELFSSSRGCCPSYIFPHSKFSPRLPPNSCPICQHPNHPYHRFLLAPLPITISQTIDPLLALYCQLPYRQQASPQHRSFKDFTPLNTTEPIPVIKGLLKIALPLYLLLHHLCERHLKLWQAVCARI